jgi:hypothetical protein
MKRKGNKNHSISATRISLFNLQELRVSQYNKEFNEYTYGDTKEMP